MSLTKQELNELHQETQLTFMRMNSMDDKERLRYIIQAYKDMEEGGKVMLACTAASLVKDFGQEEKRRKQFKVIK